MVRSSWTPVYRVYGITSQGPDEATLEHDYSVLSFSDYPVKLWRPGGEKLDPDG